MFLSCVFHVSHVAMDVKLFLQIKALEMPDLGFHHRGRQWPAFQECGSWVLVPWASFGHLSFVYALKEVLEMQLSQGTGLPNSGLGNKGMMCVSNKPFQ